MCKSRCKFFATAFFYLIGFCNKYENGDSVLFCSVLSAHKKVSDSEKETGAPLQGKLVQINVKTGDKVSKDHPLFVLEAMKMESTVAALHAGKVKKVHITEGTMVEQGDLIVEFEKNL